MNYLLGLKCSQCGKSFASQVVQTWCHECETPFVADYDLDLAGRYLDRDEIRSRPKGMWRWAELLPVFAAENRITLGEGDTPLLLQPRLAATLGLNRVYVKDESLNPTASFKARGLATAVSKALELGIQRLIIPTAGNAGGALAFYAARAGLTALIIMPSDTPRANIIECQTAGAEVRFVQGLISDAGRLAGDLSKSEGWFDVSTFKEPYRLEGKKILGYEIAEAFNWDLPEVILYPTGGGTGLVGMWKAFDELDRLGWLKTSRRPRLISVQATGCAPVVKAFEAGADHCEFWFDAKTIASGLRVPKSFADRMILASLRESHGSSIAVSDQEIQQAQVEWGRLEGVFSSPEGAATLAALRKLARDGLINRDERVVIFNTASGLKYI